MAVVIKRNGTLPRKAQALWLIESEPDLFRAGFASWLVDGWAIYEAFETQALHTAQRRQHWAANTIIEWLRHETMLRDTAEVDFKMNDMWTSSLARLFARLNPTRADLFEYRARRHGVVVKP